MQEREKYRHEIKYLIDTADYYNLKSRIGGVLKKDSHAGINNLYHIRSLYFDDIKNTDLFTKISGTEKRKKYRIRYYNNDFSFIKMEKKIKENDVSYKRSAVLEKKEAELLVKGEFDFLKDSSNALLREIYFYNKTNILRANVITDYDREPFIFPMGNVRITFDSNLKTALLNTDLFNENLILIKAVGEGQVILEVKYDEFLPVFISEILNKSNAKPLAISKFALCKKYISLNDWEVYS